MAEAVLRVRTEGGSEVKRALGATVGVARQAAQAQNADARRAAREAERIARSTAREQERAAKEAAKARIKAARDAEAAEKAALREVARAQAKIAKDIERAEAAKTKAAEREAKNRAKTAEREARELRRLVERNERDHARAERKKTADTEREARRRSNVEANAARARVGRGRAIGERAGQAGMAFASNAHGMIQGAREQRASVETTLNDAIVQAMTGQGQRGALGAMEAASLRARAYNFARDRGIREEELAPALNNVQSRFSLLSDAKNARGERTADARREALDQFLSVADLARTTGNDIGDTTQFFGAMRSMGLSPEDAQASTRQAAAAGFAGSVTMGEMSAQGLGALRQSIANATAGLTGEDRIRAIQEQTSRFVANLQLQASVGARVGVSGNRLTGIETLFGNDQPMAIVGNRLTEHFTRTNNRASRAQARAMFETDRSGNLTSLREEFRDPTRFASAMTNLFGGDVGQFRNVMGAHGTWSQSAGGANRAINTPLVSGLANVMSIGSGALAKRDEIMGAQLSDRDLEAMRAVRATEETTSLVRAQQENRDALTRNSGVVGALSKAFAEWTASNPLTAAAGGAAATGVIGLLAGKAGAAAAGSGAGAALLATGGTAVGAAGAAGIAGAVGAGGIAGVGLAQGMMAAIDRLAEPNADLNRQRYLEQNRAEQSIFSLSGWRLLAKEISDAIKGGADVRQGAAFNRANAATGATSAPPEHRARG